MSPFLLNACADLSNSSGKQIVLATAFVQARNFSVLKVWGAEEANMGTKLYFSLFKWKNTAFQVDGGLICNPKCPQRAPS